MLLSVFIIFIFNWFNLLEGAGLVKCTSHLSICKGTNKSAYMQIY
nr:MAG TPA: hypothetical protein [Caudoviricetes sp.]